ncbi:hypothetical protein TNCV_2389011 [Trichonephila clavipes]|nr:hypothetical protein TNCV_2389011 [Trichonephila clavipes]
MQCYAGGLPIYIQSTLDNSKLEGPMKSFELSRVRTIKRIFLEQMKPAKCLHQHDFEGLRSLFSDTLASDRVTGVNSSDSSLSLSVLLWSKAQKMSLAERHNIFS